MIVISSIGTIEPFTAFSLLFRGIVTILKQVCTWMILLVIWRKKINNFNVKLAIPKKNWIFHEIGKQLSVSNYICSLKLCVHWIECDKVGAEMWNWCVQMRNGLEFINNFRWVAKNPKKKHYCKSSIPTIGSYTSLIRHNDGHNGTEITNMTIRLHLICI